MIRLFQSFCLFFFSIHLFLYGVIADQVIGNVAYVHLGVESKVVLRQIKDGTNPYDLPIESFSDFVVNLDAVEYLHRISGRTEFKESQESKLNDYDSQESKLNDYDSQESKLNDKQLIEIAQRYIPTTSNDGKGLGSIIAFVKQKPSELILWIFKQFINPFKFLFGNFAFKSFTFCFALIKRIPFYTRKVTGWYYGTSSLPVKCFVGLDWIDTEAQGPFLVGWETFTLNDNCAETVTKESIEKTLSHGKINAIEDANASLCHLYKHEAGADSGEWIAKIRIFPVVKENKDGFKFQDDINNSIWDISCVEAGANKDKNKSLFSYLQSYLVALI
ncbi:hypothetical protein KGF56_002380 [Candida oxycetoniae]|uniref:Uncharacterized protein n=1 Tax=Candida oxycetoniae TaxID=497107 RepID=A0AAI9WY83_9ASCO|nr:uncharacterized protein KGF56_002380 [Candida oxycetoniae]KAI3404863.2 hypothetical protein KGF56_002380 [Candida oxycetoniae]